MEGREMPAGWEISTLGEVAGKGQYGWTTKASTCGSVKLLRTTDITKGPVNWETVPFCQENPDEIDKYVLSPGDIVVSRAGSVGFASLIGEVPVLCVFASYLIRFTPNTLAIIPRYLNRFLHSPEYWNAISGASAGIALANVNASKLSLIRVPLAPLSEQRRIAAKLDTTIAAVEACRQRLDGVAAILKRFRQAVLAAATSGELTREWREERDREQDWEPSSIKSIAEVGTGSTPLRSNQSFYSVDGMPWITSAATSEELITTANEFVTESGIKAGRLQIFPEGTLLVAMYGEGKTRGQVSELGIAASINQACAAIHSPREQHLMPFIKIALKANYLEMRQLAEGGNQPNLNLSKIKDFPVRVPPKDEVFEICVQVKSLFTLADQLEARLTAARKVVDRLTPALLAKAFRGDLVPQDPNDEPASVLLARIRAARQAEAAASKPSRRGRRKAATNPDQIAMEAAPVSADFLAGLLRECGALSERALLAVSELEPQRFQQQLYRELESGTAREVQENGQVLLEAVG